MKIISAILALAIGSSQAAYHPFYHGYNPFAALAALGLYNPHMFPAPHVPYSGTYSYHDGHKPTVVQANNDGYKFKPAARIVQPVSYAYHDVPKPTIVQANTAVVHPVPQVVQTAISGAYHDGSKPIVVQANHGVVSHPYASHVPYHGTYAYHDGDKPTVVQANNAGYSYPYAAKSLYSGTYSYHDGYKPTVVQVNNGGYKPPPVVPVSHAPNPWNPWAAPGLAAWQYHYGYPGYPHPYSIPQKTVVQANLGGHDPWNYGAYYGTGIYGFKYHNYAPAAVPVLRIE
ncbi:uncharacterized protein LOC110677064 [Aedes aegypti]|uniref:Uncharacterized protein n=1 Tax=Aedes aegypti TaxID=7159 RepID=A0A6I8TYJ5_AEDAE|nr:uncharacterized protein LOC110677064 [Aedes aegypti]